MSLAWKPSQYVVRKFKHLPFILHISIDYCRQVNEVGGKLTDRYYNDHQLIWLAGVRKLF